MAVVQRFSSSAISEGKWGFLVWTCIRPFNPCDGRGDAGKFVGKLSVVGIIGLQARHRHLRSGYLTTARDLMSCSNAIALICSFQDILAPGLYFWDRH